MAKRRAFMLSASQYMQQVRLPPEFITKSRTLAENLLKDAIHQYHRHRHECNNKVDTKQWKLVKDKHHIACYRSVTKSPISGSDETLRSPEILAVGTITGGGLEDVLHGVVNLTPEAMHVENALAHGDLIDSRILAFLSPPTSTDPFDSMTVKWVLRNHPSLTKQRDYVYLESAGMTTAPDGEPLGFLIVHSVTLTAVPEFHKDSHISRGHVAYCYLFRQRKQHGVDVFFRGTVNPLGVKDRVTMGLTVDMVVNASPATVQLAMMKKLMYCLRKLPPPEPDCPSNRQSHSSSSSSDTSNHTPGRRARSLGSNSSFLRRLTTFTSRSDSGSGDEIRRTSLFGRMHSHSIDTAGFHGSCCDKCGRHFNALKSKAKCHLCHKLVCSRCRVLKRVVALEHEMMYPEKLDFCTACISNTSNTSAAWIAAQELHELEEIMDEQENPFYRPSVGIRESTGKIIRKPIWELNLSSEDRQTMSSEFSTRSSTGDRYLISLTTNGSIAELDEATRVKNATSDLEKMGLDDVDENFSASGRGQQYGEFVLDDESDDDGDEMPIVESFCDDDFLFDDEILLTVSEQPNE